MNEEISTEKISSSLDDFWNSKDRNRWINFDGMRLYTRKSHRFYDGKMYNEVFDIATVQLDDMNQSHQGKFKHLLSVILSKFDVIYVENVINPDFYRFWLKQPGFKLYNPKNPDDPSFIYIKNVTTE